MVGGKLSHWLVFVVVVVIITANAASLVDNDIYDATTEWFKFKIGKFYASAKEETNRKNLFTQTVNKINSHNSNSTNTFKMGINQFSDLSFDEFLQRFNGNVTTPHIPATSRFTRSVVTDTVESLPLTLDYRLLGQVSPVKDQGKCGAQYAFAGVGALEHLMLRKQLQLVDLSEQQIIDCTYHMYSDTTYGEKKYNDGCGDGYTIYVAEYMLTNEVVLESRYPYKSFKSACQINSTNSTNNLMTGHRYMKIDDEDYLKHLLVTYGPVVTITIPYLSQEFISYKSGILNKLCGEHSNFQMLLVGYGTSLDGTEYWILKNSWGTTWGENGFLRLKKGLHRPCTPIEHPVVYIY